MSIDPTVTEAPDDPLRDLVAVMRRLRVECAWKAEQTPTSLVPYLREETEELVEAIAEGDPDHVCEELGDVLLQVVFHAAIAEERGDFTIDDVAAGISAKLRRRNPHVFDPASLGQGADSPPLSAAEVNEIWQQVKRDEKQTQPDA